jgi:SsrA-binding protein
VAKPRGEKLVADNRRARHEYELLERIEAGLVLKGTEVKALREGRATIQRAFADVRGSEIWLVGANIATYDKGGIANHDPERDRKLLLHRREIDRLTGRTKERGLTLVPTRVYFSGPRSRAKVEIALAKGKDRFDKRESLKKKDMQRDMQRALREVNR